MIPPGVLDRTLPWTEQDYLALGETRPRVELLDGGLLIGPPATPRHQMIVGGLADALAAGCDRAGLDLLPMVNLRLGDLRIFNPDLAVARVSDFDARCLPAREVRLVVEVSAPHTAAIDHVLKPHCYLAAGIEWYLLVQQETGALRLYRRRGSHYREQSTVKRGEVLELTEPVQATIRPEDLVP